MTNRTAGGRSPARTESDSPPRGVARAAALALALGFAAGGGCSRESPPGAPAISPVVAASADTVNGVMLQVPASLAARFDVSTAGMAPRAAFAADTTTRDARASDANIDDVGAEATERPDPENKRRPPLKSADLDERAAHLVAAIARDEPGLADDFFFPKAPFIPLKDVADPGRYFDQLLRTYHRDIAALRAEIRDAGGATFTSFELGTPPTWVAPGKEYNKIGYYRTFGGKLRYRVGDQPKEIKVSTIISWDGRWYVTHLSPIRH